MYLYIISTRSDFNLTLPNSPVDWLAFDLYPLDVLSTTTARNILTFFGLALLDYRAVHRLLLYQSDELFLQIVQLFVLKVQMVLAVSPAPTFCSFFQKLRPRRILGVITIFKLIGCTKTREIFDPRWRTWSENLVSSSHGNIVVLFENVAIYILARVSIWSRGVKDKKRYYIRTQNSQWRETKHCSMDREIVKVRLLDSSSN